MNYIKVLALSILCATSFFSHGMENKSTQEAVEAVNRSLWKAVEKEDLAKVEQIIAEGIANVNSADENGFTALIRATTVNNTDIINALIKADADVNSADKNGFTALMFAKSADIVNVLIKAGADVNSANEYGDTALMYATVRNNADIVNALIKAGADVNSVNKKGDTALINATVRKNNTDIVNALIKAGADVNSADENGYTALIYTVAFKRYNRSILLINPSQKSFARKKIERLLIIYKKNCSYLSFLPKEVLKIIITCMHPEEFTMDRELICSLHPQALVDNIPLENLAILVKDETLHKDILLAAWQKKLNGITESVKAQKKLTDTYIQEFATEALTKITMLLTQ